jgi:hypothetical protein
VDTDFDITLWELPTTTIRHPDVALYDCAPEDVRPLLASYVKIVDTGDKMAEYAVARISWYWVVWVQKSRDVHRCPCSRPHLGRLPAASRAQA